MSLRNNHLLYLFAFISLIFSCKNKNSENQDLNSKQIQVSKFVKHKISNEKYNFILKAANDSINSWIKNKLGFYTILENSKWEMDSLFCINTNEDKIIFSRNVKCSLSPCKMDNINFFYGVKISNRWYFFDGPVIYIPRSEINNPTSFKKLHEIAMQEIFSGYLIKNKKTGDWEINEAFFASIPNKNTCVGCTGYGPCFECKTENEYYMYVVNDNWKHKDTTNYERLREEEMKKK